MTGQESLQDWGRPGGVAADGDGIVRSAPRVLLRVEGAVLLGLAILGYALYGSSWWLLALLLLVPDVGALGYLAGPRIGAPVYNAFHTYAGPGVLVAIGAGDGSTILL